MIDVRSSPSVLEDGLLGLLHAGSAGLHVLLLLLDPGHEHLHRDLQGGAWGDLWNEDDINHLYVCIL